MMRSVIRKFLFLISFFLLVLSHPSPAVSQYIELTDSEVSILFDEPLEGAAKEVAAMYPELRTQVEEKLRWKLNYRPNIVLVREEKKFRDMTGHDFFAAFAVPRKKLIVIDYSKMSRSPFRLRVVLKHEICHLLLHHHISRANLPRWLDEGVSQWVSDGISELIMDRKRSLLRESVLSGNYIPLRALNHRFPRDKLAITLAYEQSKSLTEYLEHEFGEKGILTILKYLKEGDAPGTAIQRAISMSVRELERGWHDDLEKKNTWFVFLAVHTYDIIFFISALALIYGFVKSLIRKRAYQDEDDEDDEIYQ